MDAETARDECGVPLSLTQCRRQFPSGTEVQECSIGTVRRTVWEGDDELIEIQAPVRLYGDAADRPLWQQDNDTLSLKLPLASGPFTGAGDPHPFFGSIVYTHGLGRDQPVGLTRYRYADSTAGNVAGSRIEFPPTTVALVWNTVGKLTTAFCANGQAQCTATNGTRTDSMVIGIPAMWFAYARPQYIPASFSGTLLTDKEDGTRTHYRRNRYYDPASGRFTQEDPIGLAGGLNLYGYAGSDPVNLADPFGLCPIPVLCEALDIAAVAMDIRDIRRNGLGWGNGIALVADVAAVAIPVVPAVAGAAERAAV